MNEPPSTRRPRLGRPPLPDEERKINLNISLTTRQRSRLQAEAKAADVTISSVVRQALEAWWNKA